MDPNKPITSVQMVEYNPAIGNKRKTYTVSGVMAFTAGSSVQDEPYKPSPIVPLKNPDMVINYQGIEVPLVEFLTGRDSLTGGYYVHQPRNLNLPVFKLIVAPNMQDLRKAVHEHANIRAQMGMDAVPAPIQGAAAMAMERPKKQRVKDIAEILAESQKEDKKDEPTAVAPPEPKDEMPEFKKVVEKVNNKGMTVKMAKAELQALVGDLDDESMEWIVGNSKGKVKTWAENEIDRRFAGEK